MSKEYSKITSIEEIDYKGDTYNLHVDDNHNYFANSMLAKNCHLFKAKSLTSIMDKLVDCEYRFGFTGTLDDSQCHKLVIQGMFGDVYQTTTSSKLIDEGTLAKFDIKIMKLGYDKLQCKEMHGKSYQEEMDFIVTNEKRNKFILNLANSLKGNTLILFQYKEKQGEPLKKLIHSNSNKTLHYVTGDTDGDERENVRQYVEKSTNNIILATYGVYKAGVNIRNLNNIIFASFSKSKITALQSIGRGLRKSETKTKATLYDLADDMIHKKDKPNFAMKHFETRLNIYEREKFPYKIYPIHIGG